MIPLADRLYDEHLAEIAADRRGKTMAKPNFQRLRSSLSAQASALTDEWDCAMSLGELRRARPMTQHQLAADLHVGQASIAKPERRTDMYLSTLRRFVEAMGRDLEIVARFPDQPPVRLHGIGDLAEEPAS